MFIRICGGLIFTPYKTVRTESISVNYSFALIVGLLSFFYFVLAKATMYQVIWGTGVALGLFFYSVYMFALLPGEGAIQDRVKRYYSTWSLTYIPTLIWFYTSFFLFMNFPPPRSQSVAGTLLSILFLAFSLSLLTWKVILVYLSIRFSSRVQLYRVLYYIFLYLAVSIPLWVLFYNLRIFRIPFVWMIWSVDADI
mgnify:CR=1 FL=1